METLLRLLMYIGLLTMGIVVGAKVSFPKKFNKLIGWLQLGSVLLLLFVMGLRIGINERVLESFGSIGLRATGLSIGAIAGSVLLLLILKKKIVTWDKEGGEHHDN